MNISAPQGITVIGIDPGSRITGWGVVREESGVLRLVDCGAVHAVSGGAAGKDVPFSQRLALIYRELASIVARLQPQEGAVEQIFTAKNAASALKLGQARGVAVAACAAHGVPVSDYEPTVVKKSLVGTGGADKQQVSFMVGRLLNVKPDWVADTGDALGVAICHLSMRRLARLTGRTA